MKNIYNLIKDTLKTIVRNPVKTSLITFLVVGNMGCSKIKEPQKENYKSYTIGDYALLKNVDSDSLVDVIYHRSDPSPAFTDNSKESEEHSYGFTKKMSPELEASATRLLKEWNEFQYQMAKIEYSAYIKDLAKKAQENILDRRK